MCHAGSVVGSLNGKSSELIAERRRVEKAHSVHFASTLIKLINPPERFDVPDERPRILAFHDVNQYSPILA
jgi:hypothetical protein